MDVQTFGNYSSCCRLCLSENPSCLKSVFDGFSSSLVDQIRKNIGIEIKNADKISILVCQPCIFLLNNWIKYKENCLENQKTLQSWMENWDSNNVSNMTLQIKDEAIFENEERLPSSDRTDGTCEKEIERIIKNEPMDTDQSNRSLEITLDDLPPPLLTPHPPDHLEINQDLEEIEDNSQESNITNSSGPILADNNICKYCNKVFSSSSNRRKHEKKFHLQESENTSMDETSPISEASTGENSNVSNINAEDSSQSNLVENSNDSDQQKIQFAANLKLQLQQNNSPNPNSFTFNGFTKIEASYSEKCKAMLKMTETNVCVCHNEQYNSFKKILQHIRKYTVWFPCYTCFNCMITFTDRSTYMKHYANCRKEKLINLKRLAETKENDQMKVRLYQLYVCTICNFVFSYHEDFCQHVNSFHVGESETNTTCQKCKKTFDTVDSLKRHMYLSSCIMNYRCDICHKFLATMTEFKAHCETEHDKSDGFSFQRDENFTKRFSAPPNLINTPSKKLKIAPPLKPEVQHLTTEDKKLVNPHALLRKKKGIRSSCPVCGKVYSSYHNMMRHLKVHSEVYNTFNCEQCSQTFRLVTELRSHINEVHNKIIKKPRVSNSKKYSCDDCGKTFLDMNQLEAHRSVHLNIKLYRDSKTHSYKSRSVGSLMMCEVCDKIFNTNDELIEHKRLHEEMPVLTAQDRFIEEKKVNVRKWQCKPCNKSYSGYSGLWDHNNRHHPGQKMPSEFPRKCQYCSKMLLNGGSWNMHRKMHERIPITPKSQKQLKSNNHIKDHSKTSRRSNDNDNEDSESYHTCKKCFKVFSGRSNLRNHMKCHGISPGSSSRSQGKQGKQSKTYWCDVCHQACQGLAELENHKKEHLDEVISLPEEEVSARGTQKLNLFLCDLCDKDFTNKFALKKHKEQHDFESSPVQKKKYFYCKHCKIPFKNMKILEDHMKEEHDETFDKPKVNAKQSATSNSEETFACDVCQKVFHKLTALYAHQGWHNRDKMKTKAKTQEKLFQKMVNSISNKKQVKVQQPKIVYKCLSCYVQFATEMALQIHVLEKHRTISFFCGPCNLNFDTQKAYNKHQQLHNAEAQIQQNSNLQLKKYKCKSCDRAFDKQSGLTTHSKVHEKKVPNNFTSENSIDKLPIKFYSCSICHAGFQIAKDLRNHIITTHPF